MNRTIRNLSVALLLGAATGCAILDRGLDTVGDALADEAAEYCGQPVYRRDALRSLVNGRLEQSGIRMEIICPVSEP